jgi:50S ribosomal protein L16 3-hydroxylase
MNSNQALRLLNDLTPAQFLAEYWQKKPLLIKNAMPGFTGILTPEELAGLACEDEVQSRIVQKKSGQWTLSNGPFDEVDFSRLPDQDWTLLVQSVNHFLPEATDLLRQFDFIPHARLDDLMVSYAPDGGGVGPHFDSYDVFLLQGQGKRLWRISEQTDLSLIEGAPLRILKQFETSEEWLLEVGDMLYLPPQIAHWGIAVSDGGQDCMTYSIGFRAPKHQELASEFLGYMQDKLQQDSTLIPGIYQDEDLELQTHPAEISSAMVKKVSANLKQISWSDEDVGEFLGSYLSEPKNHVVFEPNKKISVKAFSDKVAKQGVSLDLKSQMLFFANQFFINGEAVTIDAASEGLLRTLADTRQMLPSLLNDDILLQRLYDWYLAGYVHISNKAT